MIISFLLAKLLLKSLMDGDSCRHYSSTGHTSAWARILEYVYNNGMDRVNKQQEGRRQTGISVLSWVVHIRRPLTVKEFKHALSIEGQSKLDPKSTSDIEDLVSRCAGLVIVDHKSDIVRAVHSTAQGYLEEWIGEYFPTAHENITITCLACLGSQKSQKLYHENDESTFQELPFLSYSVPYWGMHAHKSQPQILS